MGGALLRTRDLVRISQQNPPIGDPRDECLGVWVAIGIPLGAAFGWRGS